MKNAIALELKVLRRKAGFTQADCAHLLGCRQARISEAETGGRLLSLLELYQLSLVYGKSLERFLAELAPGLRSELANRLPSLPSAPKRWLPRYTREKTLANLTARLGINPISDHGGA